jgi:hypothetical protein
VPSRSNLPAAGGDPNFHRNTQRLQSHHARSRNRRTCSASARWAGERPLLLAGFAWPSFRRNRGRSNRGLRRHHARSLCFAERPCLGAAPPFGTIPVIRLDRNTRGLPP